MEQSNLTSRQLYQAFKANPTRKRFGFGRKPALINIDNHDFDDAEDIRAGQLFFSSVITFKDTFTKNLPMHVHHKVKSITIKVDFNNIPTPVNVSEVQ